MLIVTTILHPIRHKYGLSNNDYCCADLIDKLSHNPDSPHPGWCSMSRENMAGELGCSRQSVITMIKKLEAVGLVVRDPHTDDLKTTKLWYVETTDCKEFLQGVKKLDTLSKSLTPRKKGGNGVKNLDTHCQDSLQGVSNNCTPDCQETLQEPVQKFDTIDSTDSSTETGSENFLNDVVVRDREKARQIADSFKKPADASPSPLPPSPSLANYQSQLEAQKTWWDDSCISLELTPEQLKSYFTRYMAEMRRTQKVHKDFSDFQSHAYSWIRLQRDKTSTPLSNAVNPGTTYSNRAATNFNARQQSEPQPGIANYGKF